MSEEMEKALENTLSGQVDKLEKELGKIALIIIQAIFNGVEKFIEFIFKVYKISVAATTPINHRVKPHKSKRKLKTK